MTKRLFYSCFLLIFLVSNCVPPSTGPSQEEKLLEVKIDFNDATTQKIYTLQDRLATDSLFGYCQHKNPTYRYLAAMSFASIQDKKALPVLENLLKDNVDLVRIAAAFSIGQMGDSISQNALIASFQQSDTLGKSQKLNATILEAVGKCAAPRFLKSVATVSTYNVTDTLLLEGQAWGIYRYALRSIVAAEGTKKMVETVSNNRIPNSVRFVAASYLLRAKEINIDSIDAVHLASVMPTESDYRIRMGIASALGKAHNGPGYQGLLSQYSRELDYRVKSTIIKAFGNYRYGTVAPMILNSLNDKNPHIANASARFFYDNGLPIDAPTLYWKLAKDSSLNVETQALMYQVTNKYTPYGAPNTKNAVNWEINRKYDQASTPYEKVTWLKAMGENLWNYKIIHDKGFSASHPAIKTGAVSVLKDIANASNFYYIYGLGAKDVRYNLFVYFMEAINTGNVGMMAEAAEGLRSSTLNFKSFYDGMKTGKDFLTIAQGKLKLPRDIETWNALQKTIDYCSGTAATTPKQPTYNQPIDWKLLNALPEKIQADIQTQYGTITVDLLKKTAPGTVLNFVQLAKNGYFDGKNFHRVVSNFVAQGGCPRGDGYGSMDYTIRSELLPLHYDEAGYLAMASSGLHTECAQFFITTAPALHLDGRYTIFGKVTAGLDLVQRIQIGDVMTKVVIR
jgi:cyclophilin family peptidyl-prolyl cis-trans isomerase/HEAT repeat protein